MNPIVSAKWLKDNLDRPEMVILNASFPKPGVVSDTFSDERLIPHSRFFDIKNKFSDVSAPFPSTFPSVEQFTQEAQLLGINKSSVIVVYDDKGIYSSARAWWLFRAFGHYNVAVLDGGLPEWNKFNYRTERYQPYEGSKGNFIGLEDKSYMKFFEDVKVASPSKSYTIIDARNEKRFKCLVDEPKIGLRRGTIPNSINLPYENLLNGNCLRSVAELKQIFNALVKPSDNLIFSCGSGIT
ncbi:MAG: rhodanese-like domain-containing protein, partial [Gelidibacter sp.]